MGRFPQDPFNRSAIGAVVLLPAQSPYSIESPSQENLVCNLAAGWGPSTLHMSMQVLGGSRDVRSGIRVANFVKNEMLSYHVNEQDPGIADTESLVVVSIVVFLRPFYTKRLINISLDWAQYLNPFAVDLNVTIFHQLMQANFTDRNPRVSAAIILPCLLAKGLARIGIESSLQGDLKMTNKCSGRQHC